MFLLVFEWESKGRVFRELLEEETLGDKRMSEGIAFPSLGTMTEKALSSTREESEAQVDDRRRVNAAWLVQRDNGG